MLTTSRTVDISLPRPFPWQRQVQREARRFNCCAVGRRAGKSTMSYELLIRPALEGYPTGYFAPTYKLLSDTWRNIKRNIQPVLRSANATDHRIELLTGGVIEMWTLEDENAGRSRKYKRAVIDEAGLIHDLAARWNDAIRPTLADYEGDAWMLGTPKGRNFFWQMHQWGEDATMQDWAAWQMPTTVNPLISPAEIEDMRRTMSERSFAQEILAQFLDDAGGVFRKVQAAAAAVPQDAPEADHQYVMGVDLARRSDFTVLCVVDVTMRQLVWLDRFNQIDWSLQVGRITAAAERFNPSQIIVDQTGVGDPIVEQLRRDLPGVSGFMFTNATKAQVIEGLALAFERDEIAILPDPTLIGELQAYTSERLASGMTRYNAPEGLHDDCVISLALAWYGAARPSPADYLAFVEL